MDSENKKPFIQIGDEMREMNDDEYSQYLIDQQNITPLPFTQVEPNAE